MIISDNLKKLSKIFHKHSPLYVVGGYVRDFLLNKPSFDIDICSELSADETVNLLEGTEFKTIAVNKKIGTLLIVKDDEKYEYTSFRKDNYALDGKHLPLSAEFKVKLSDDILRRDFTVNALYFDIRTGEIIGDLRGESDIKAKILRTVKNPDIVFKEDSLRIFRMLRLACLSDFDIENETFEKAEKNSYLVNSLSSERIVEELRKFVGDKECDRRKFDRYIDLLYRLNILGVWYDAVPEPLGIDVKIKSFPSRVEYIYLCFFEKYFSSLLKDCLDGVRINSIDDIAAVNIRITDKLNYFFVRDRLKKETKKFIVKAIAFFEISAMCAYENTAADLCIIYYYDIINTIVYIDDAVDCNGMVFLEKLIQRLDYLKRNKLPLKLSELNVSAQKLLQIGIPCNALQKTLRRLLEAAVLEKVENNENKLTEYLKELR